MPTKSEVAAQARKYIGMAFRAQGRSHPGEGRSATIDCAGLLVCVAEDLGIHDSAGVPIARRDYTDRGAQAMDEFLQMECKRRLIERAAGETPQPGDVLTLRAPHSISHCGIVSELEQDHAKALGLVFAYPVRLRNSIKGQIVEVRLDERWRGRIAGVFAYPGVA